MPSGNWPTTSTPPDRLSEQQVRDHFLHLKDDRKFASASLGIAYSGIKFAASRGFAGSDTM